MGTWLGKGNDPRYTPTTTFETFLPLTGGTLTRRARQRLPHGSTRALRFNRSHRGSGLP